MADQINPEGTTGQEASGLLLSVDPMNENAPKLWAQSDTTDTTDAGSDTGDSDSADTGGSDGADGDGTDGTDGDGTDGTVDADGTDDDADADGTDSSTDADGTDA